MQASNFRQHTTLIFQRDRNAARAAVLRMSRRLRMNDGDAEAWHALGAALSSLGDRVAAIVAFRNALRLDDSRVPSRRALGNLLFDSGQCERALSWFGIAEGVR